MSGYYTTVLDSGSASRSREESIAFLAIASVEGIGYWALRSLFEVRRSFFDLFTAEDAQLASLLKGSKRLAHVLAIPKDELWRRGVEALELMQRRGVLVLTATDPSFPDRLHRIDEPPYWLFVQGNSALLRSKSIAAVGTRKPTEDGIFLAKYTGAVLQYLKCSVVSGLAVGVDHMIHTQALRYRQPTIAVLGHGLFAAYHAMDLKLRDAIVGSGGAVISEYLPQQGPSAENFVRRNRLQSGLSCGVVPIEWNVKSGTAHTVQFALQQGRALAALRLPDWPEREELAFAEANGGAVFTVPGDDRKLEQYLENALQGVLSWRPQLSLPLA